MLITLPRCRLRLNMRTWLPQSQPQVEKLFSKSAIGVSTFSPRGQPALGNSWRITNDIIPAYRTIPRILIRRKITEKITGFPIWILWAELRLPHVWFIARRWSMRPIFASFEPSREKSDNLGRAFNISNRSSRISCTSSESSLIVSIVEVLKICKS